MASKRKLLALVDSIIRLPVTYDEALKAIDIAVKQPMSTVHAHYRRNGFESCPTCGAWLGPHQFDGDRCGG